MVEVATKAGPVSGVAFAGGIAFLGIPFGQSPIGDLRFQPPIPAAPWTHPLATTDFSKASAQAPSPFFKGESSEDSLYLNVWATPAQTTLKPVLVFIYGGGFEGGTASSANYSGEHLSAAGNLVFVSMNYRVGLLGFGAFEESPEYPATTNLGIRDVILALQWVQDNIEFFGGDPDNVTVMGQSAGAFIACSLAVAPSAQGLFHKLVLLSGGASRVVPLERALEIGKSALKELAIDQEDLARIRLEQLFEAQKKVLAIDIGVRNASRPNALGVVDDSPAKYGILDGHPMQHFSRGKGTQIPLLVAVDEAEIAIFRRYSPAETFDPKSIAALEGEVASWGIGEIDAKRIVSAYAEDSGELGLVRERLLTDWIYRLPAARLARAQAESGGPAWLAEFRGTSSAPMGHGEEMPAIFDGMALERAIVVAPEFRLTSQQAIIDFVQTGNPGWPQFDSADGKVKIISQQSKVENHVFDGILKLWEGIDRP